MEIEEIPNLLQLKSKYSRFIAKLMHRDETVIAQRFVQFHLQDFQDFFELKDRPWSDINRRILNPAIAEIENTYGYRIQVLELKLDRRVAAIKLIWQAE